MVIRNNEKHYIITVGSKRYWLIILKYGHNPQLGSPKHTTTTAFRRLHGTTDAKSVAWTCELWSPTRWKNIYAYNSDTSQTIPAPMTDKHTKNTFLNDKATA